MTEDNKHTPSTDELMAMLSEQMGGQQQDNSRVDRANRIYTFLVFFLWVGVSALLGLLVNARCGWMFSGFWSLAMYLNITVTTLSNVTLGREIDSIKDAGWKSIFGFGAALCLAVAFSL